VKPIFQALVDVGECGAAIDWFADYESFYNSYVVGGVSRVLAADCDGDEGTDPDMSTASTVAVTVIPLVTAMVLAVVAF
jgi:hypothetical protein